MTSPIRHILAQEPDIRPITLGFACPECGDTNIGVTDSRPHAAGIRRRRRCTSDHRFTTLEVIVDDADDAAVTAEIRDMLTPAKLPGIIARLVRVEASLNDLLDILHGRTKDA